MSQTHMQRVMKALESLRAHFANLVSGGMVDAAKAAETKAVARADAADREKEQIVMELEKFVAEVLGPPPAVEEEPEEDTEEVEKPSE